MEMTTGRGIGLGVETHQCVNGSHTHRDTGVWAEVESGPKEIAAAGVGVVRGHRGLVGGLLEGRLDAGVRVAGDVKGECMHNVVELGAPRDCAQVSDADRQLCVAF